MTARNRVIALISIMACIVLLVEFAAIGFLYSTAFREQGNRLGETAKSQARFIETIARSGGAETALRQMTDAYSHYQGFGITGEFTLAKKEGDQIVFLLVHRHYDMGNPRPVPFSSNLAEPMRLALSGKSGTVIGLDYRGEKVLAAYEPVAKLNWGIVAKIDIGEVRHPFIIAALMSGGIGFIAIGIGCALFIFFTNPLINNLAKTIAELQNALNKVKLLSGLLPICASCKKIRDDKGNWNQLESYIHSHSEADFSHSLCPDCMREMYPEFSPPDKK